MTPRPYQIDSLAALEDALRTYDDNPCLVLPTGSGKTPTMAWSIQSFIQRWPNTRVLILAHVKELLSQGVEKMRTIWPAAPIGVYSAGLRSKDVGYAITYAGIQSIYNKAHLFPSFDLIYVDEAHRIPIKSEGMYHKFFEAVRLVNPDVRIVGWTATDYRLAGGSICHPNYILNRVAYKANVKDLIDDGYLSPLRTKIGVDQVSTDGVSKSGGDFNTAQLEAKITDDMVKAIAADAVTILNRENRQSVIFFCCTKDHAERMSRALDALCLNAPTITDDTPSDLRDYRAEMFKAGKIRGLCNINVLSEGFDAQRVDAVVLIRPTASKGLYYQQVGRGLRLFPGKTDCLVIDYAGNIARHGPIDHLEGQAPVLCTCPQCREAFPQPMGKCPACGWEIPPQPAPEAPAEKAERQIPTDAKARVEAAILSNSEPWDAEPLNVYVHAHQKAGKPTSLCVEYARGMSSYREWICLEHTGYALHKAHHWWRARFGDPVPATVAEALAGNLFLGDAILEKTASIRIRQNGKYPEIISAKLRGNELAAVAG